MGNAEFQVTVIRSARRKRTIALRVEGGAVTVRAPLRASEKSIAELLTARRGWILKRIAEQANAPAAVEYRDGVEIPYRGGSLRLLLAPGAKRTSTVATDGSLTIGIGAGEAEPTGVGDAVRKWYRAQAVEVLGEMARTWSERTGLVPSRVLVRDQKRRWGSCAPDRTIRLNWRLILLADELAEYVVVHELAHLAHRNHQPAFWAEVERQMPDYRERRKRLAKGGHPRVE